MEYTIIDIPDMNDSVSRVVLNNKEYNIRFTYNDSYDYWKFSLYDSQSNPIYLNIKIVPKFPLNIFIGTSDAPSGFFGVKTSLLRIGRNDFKDKNAKFIFCPVSINE